MSFFKPSLLFYAIFFFYFWVARLEYGFLPGFLLTCIAFSFFILCTPMASYGYLLGCYPVRVDENSGLLRVFLPWFVFLLLNCILIYFVPTLYGRGLIYQAVHSMIATYPVNVFTLGFSGGMLLYHWCVTRIKFRSGKHFLHILGILFSLTVAHFTIHRNRKEIVFYLMDMSYSNY